MKTYLLKILFLNLLFVSAPVFSAANLPFLSDFETGNFSEWDGGADATLIVTNEDSSRGQYSARAQMINGQAADNYKDFYFGDHVSVNGQAANDELWLQFDSKFDSSFDFGSNERIHKLAIINFTDENARRRYQMIVNLLLPEETFFIENLAWNADRSFDKTVDAYQQNTGDPVVMTRGQWDTVKMYLKLNTPGQRNGILRVWVNNQQIIEVTNSFMREGSNYNPNKLILSNYSRDSDLIGFQRWDNFYLAIEPPADTKRPKAPVLNSAD